MKKTVSILLLLCLLAFCIPAKGYADRAPEKLSFQAVTPEGDELDSPELFRDNKLTALCVWETWNESCEKDLDELARQQEKLEKLRCGVVGLVLDSAAAESLKEIAAGEELPFPILLVEGEPDFLPEEAAFPAVFLVDAEGQQVREPIPGEEIARLEEIIRSALGESGTASGSNGAGTEPVTVLPSPLDGMVLVCEGDVCHLVPADSVTGGTSSPPTYPPQVMPVVPADSETGNPLPEQPAEEEAAQTAEEEIYPACPIIIIIVSETEIIGIAAGEYAGMDGYVPPAP